MRAPSRLAGGALLTGAVAVLALTSLAWTPEPPARMRIALRLKPPFRGGGLAGTDALGHDIASMLMAGAWTSLSIAVPAVLLGLVAGAALGTTAAAVRGATEEVVSRVADVLFAFPALISAVMIGALIGPGRLTAVLAIGVFAVPVFTRVARAAALGVWAQDFCRAAECAGKGRLRITLDHVLPNIAGALAVQATLQVGLAILVEAGLSFLGLSVPPPASSWGRMLGEAQTYLGSAPWMAVMPGLAVAVAVGGLTLLGDGLRDRLDPRGPRA